MELSGELDPSLFSILQRELIFDGKYEIAESFCEFRLYGLLSERMPLLFLLVLLRMQIGSFLG